MKHLDFPKVTASQWEDKSVYPSPGLGLGPFSTPHPAPPGPASRMLLSTLVFIWPPRPHQKPGIREEPDTPFRGGQACSCPGHPYGKSRSPSSALPSANLCGRGCRLNSVSQDHNPGQSPGYKKARLPPPPLPAASPHVLSLVHRPGPRPRPPLAAPRLPPLLPPPRANRLGWGSM